MANWEEIRREWQTSKITFKALAEKYGVKESTIRSRKNREKWQRNDATQRTTKKQNVATKNKRTKKESSSNGQKNRSGNPNPSHKFPKHNSFAKKHGFFSKYIPQETLEIMGTLEKDDPADILWDQIMIQYAAIIRAQEIMFVADKDEMIKELKKAKYDYIPDSDEKGKLKQLAVEEEYEFQFAWDRHATFLNAQSRAISELRTSIRQFNDMAHEEDERRLKLELMQAQVSKVNAEVEKISNKDDDKPIEIMIRRKGERS